MEKSRSSYLVDIDGLVFSENNELSSWIHALPVGKYKHALYGNINITSERVRLFADGVKNRIRGIDPSVNYNHDNDSVAAGWVKGAEARPDGLWLLVEWVKDAAQSIKDKKWRYFSCEFVDEWNDPQGNEHKDVILGGALTNRPFMKNLVPINLSEKTVDLAFDLVGAITGRDADTLKGGSDMTLSEEDLKKIVDGVATRLSESKPKDTPPPQPSVSLMDVPELKALAEENPMVALLIKEVEKKNADLALNEKELKEADIARRLSEFDRSKIVLTPVARELTENLASRMPNELGEDFWKLLSEMKRGSTFLVELGERAGATVNYGSRKTYKKQFDDLAAGLRAEYKLSDADAYERAASQDPSLYNRYRSELMSEGVDR